MASHPRFGGQRVTGYRSGQRSTTVRWRAVALRRSTHLRHLSRDRGRRQEEVTDPAVGSDRRRRDARRGLPLQIRHRGLRLGLGLRCVVDDLTLIGRDAVDGVEQDRRVVHRKTLEHGAHPLAADLGPLVVVGRGADVERAATDELNRVGEVGQGQQAADGALGRVVDVVEVRQPVGRDVQDLFDVVTVLGEQVGEVGELADLSDQRLVVLVEEALDVGQRLIQRAEGLIEILRAVGEHLRYRGDVIGELHDLLVAVRQRVHQHLQIAHGPEQVRARISETSCGLRQFAQRVAERVAVTVEGVGGLVHECGQRSLHVTLLRTQRCAELGELFLDVVPLDRDTGAVQPDLRSIGEYGTSGVGGGELNEPRRHQVRGDDECAGIGRQLHAVLDGDRDLHVLGPRFDRVDGSDRDADHAHVVTRVQADRGREVRDHLVRVGRRPEHEGPADQCGNQHADDGDAQPRFGLFIEFFCFMVTSA